MWRQLAIVLLVASCGTQRARPEPAPVSDKEEQPAAILLGPIERTALGGEPYGTWFDEQYGGYELDTLTLALLADSLVDVDVKIFLGTWCHDSRREVPRVYKILDYLGYPAEQVTLIALGRDKHGPAREEEGFDIELVPTIIFYRGGVEIGRIIESPTDTLEEDLLDILLD
jgi:hypothetical protein